MKRLLCSVTAALGLAACQTGGTGEAPPTTAVPLTADAVAGRTLSNAEAGVFQIGADGSLTGLIGSARDEALVGTWSVADGQWCRTITEPARIAGSACQEATQNDDGTVTIVGRRGPVTYLVE
ncbi:MAG: hypothetical protein AAF577_14545 [Pseudomonadota bacterium]